MKQKKLNQVAATAQFLITMNGKTTTLDIKERLREEKPKKTWNQKEISNAMQTIYANQIVRSIDFIDKGNYREYFLQQKELDTSNFTIVSATKTEMSEYLRELDGSNGVGINFKTKKDEDRYYEGYVNMYDEYMNPMGYIQFQTDEGDFKSISPRKISRVIDFESEIIMELK